MEQYKIKKEIQRLEKEKHSTVSWVKFDKYQDKINKLKKDLCKNL